MGDDAPPQWVALAEQLPLSGSETHRGERARLFDVFDFNGNGFLSLAEVDKGLIQIWKIETGDDTRTTDYRKAAILRAFQAAKQHSGKTEGIDGDFVTRAEFRMLLIALRRYFQLLDIFQGVDTGENQRIDEAEFVAKATETAHSWGFAVDDARAEFWAIDRNAGGQILFDEFSKWALGRGLAAAEGDATAELGDEVLASLHTFADDAAAVHAEELAARPENVATAGARDRGWAELQAARAQAERDAQPKYTGWTATPRADDPTTAAREDVPQWMRLAEVLPTRPRDKHERKKLFDLFDFNRNHYLSLAEVDRGLIERFRVETHEKARFASLSTRHCKPAVLRAFQLAKDASGNTDGLNADYITRSEFKLLLIALQVTLLLRCCCPSAAQATPIPPTHPATRSSCARSDTLSCSRASRCSTRATTSASTWRSLREPSA